eukprot:1117259-Karenia_brevis.AAC.1
MSTFLLTSSNFLILLCCTHLDTAATATEWWSTPFHQKGHRALLTKECPSAADSEHIDESPCEQLKQSAPVSPHPAPTCPLCLPPGSL